MSIKSPLSHRDQEPENGVLYVVGTPIGNLSDISFRAIEILKKVSLIFCEDTRQTTKLLQKYHFKNHLISFNKDNCFKKIPNIINDLKDKKSNTIISSGTMLDENNVDLLEQNAIDEVWVRSAITCETRHGICAKCYGRDLAKGRSVSVGESVGVVAAQSIGEPGTQLTMRTFHIGGAASRSVAANSIEVKSSGTARFHNLKVVVNTNGDTVVVSRSGELGLTDSSGREKERYKIPYGAVISIKDGESVEFDQELIIIK